MSLLSCPKTSQKMIGYIDGENNASLKLHERFGFNRVGHLPGVAYRHGKWSDSVMVQRSRGPGTTTLPGRLGRDAG